MPSVCQKNKKAQKPFLFAWAAFAVSVLPW